MINAELLKLRKRRGLFWLSLVLTAGIVVIANVVAQLYHVSDPVKYPAVGGAQGFVSFLGLFNIVGALAAVLIGATAGAQDVGSGVFRSLVATGQSRIKLALVRIPGGLIMLLPMLALGFALEVVASFVLAGGTRTPDAATILTGFGWLMAVAVLNYTVALGLAALLRARGTAIGLLIAWQLAASRLLEGITNFGNWRGLISSVATDRFLPGATDTIQLRRDSITVTLGVAIAVVIVWIAISTALGVWRTATQEA
jgi:ABC-type transport system involved in multi-copper enzyme maturation permease subunit